MIVSSAKSAHSIHKLTASVNHRHRRQLVRSSLAPPHQLYHTTYSPNGSYYLATLSSSSFVANRSGRHHYNLDRHLRAHYQCQSTVAPVSSHLSTSAPSSSSSSSSSFVNSLVNGNNHVNSTVCHHVLMELSNDPVAPSGATVTASSNNKWRLSKSDQQTNEASTTLFTCTRKTTNDNNHLVNFECVQPPSSSSSAIIKNGQTEPMSNQRLNHYLVTTATKTANTNRSSRANMTLCQMNQQQATETYGATDNHKDNNQDTTTKTNTNIISNDSGGRQHQQKQHKDVNCYTTTKAPSSNIDENNRNYNNYDDDDDVNNMMTEPEEDNDNDNNTIITTDKNNNLINIHPSLHGGTILSAASDIKPLANSNISTSASTIWPASWQSMRSFSTKSAAIKPATDDASERNIERKSRASVDAANDTQLDQQQEYSNLKTIKTPLSPSTPEEAKIKSSTDKQLETKERDGENLRQNEEGIELNDGSINTVENYANKHSLDGQDQSGYFFGVRQPQPVKETSQSNQNHQELHHIKVKDKSEEVPQQSPPQREQLEQKDEIERRMSHHRNHHQNHSQHHKHTNNNYEEKPVGDAYFSSLSLNHKDNHKTRDVQAKMVLPHKKQSPISIMSENPVHRPCHKALVMEYPATLDGLRLNNTGFTWEVKLAYQQSIITTLTGGTLPGLNRYRLDQFHCHWGSSNEAGSEHSVDGHLFTAELHFVHYNMEKYHTMSKAARHPDGLAVVAVFLEASDDHLNHAELDKVSSNIKSIPNKGDSLVLKQSIRLDNLLPLGNRSYWSYQGSLTTPPYYESVTWFVLKQPLRCSSSQIEKFRQLHSSESSSTCCGGNGVSSMMNSMLIGDHNQNQHQRPPNDLSPSHYLRHHYHNHSHHHHYNRHHHHHHQQQHQKQQQLMPPHNQQSGDSASIGNEHNQLDQTYSSSSDSSLTNDNSIKSNHRDTQPLHGRIVYSYDERSL